MCNRSIFIVVGLFIIIIITRTEARPFQNSSQRSNVSRMSFVKGLRLHSSKNDIVFPEDSNQIIDLKIEESPKCASGETFCENFSPYPTETIQKIVEKEIVFKEFWGKDDHSEVVERDGLEDNFVCVGMQKTIFPNVAKNKNNKWKYVVNQPNGDFKQGIRIETCRFPNRACELLSELPNGYVTYCKQKYMYRRLISLDDDGTARVDTFPIPSACCCAYRRSFEFLQRFGKPVTPADKGD